MAVSTLPRIVMTRKGPGTYRSEDGKYTLQLARDYSLCRAAHDTPEGRCTGAVEHPYAYWQVLADGEPLVNPAKHVLLTRFDLRSA